MNRITNEFCDYVHRFITLHIQQLTLKSFLDIADLIVPSFHSFLNHFLFIFHQLYQSTCCSFVLRRIDFQVIVNSSGWINSSVLNSPQAFFFWLFKETDQRRSDLQRSKQVNLSISLRESIHNPSIHSAVRLL